MNSVIPERSARTMVDDIVAHLADYGVTVDGLDQTTDHDLAPVTIVVAGQPVSADARSMVSASTQAILNHHLMNPDNPTLAVADRIHGRTADALRAAGVWFVDGTGNAYIHTDRSLIDVRGRRPQPHNVRSARSALIDRSESATSLLTTKRSQVIFAILSEPDLVRAPFRTLSLYSGTSIGTAKETIDLLISSGYVSDDGVTRTLTNGRRLLDTWARASRSTLLRRLTLWRLDGATDQWRTPAGTSIAVSGEFAVPRLIRHPQELVLYADTADGSPSEFVVTNRWRKSADGPITIRRKFWHGLPGLDGDGTAPAPLVYADLLAARDPRLTEAATTLLETDVRLNTL